ncbi:hypothetical protein SAMN05444369_101290 [Capnocytophaga haemolytica]|uniref:Uncharacterized protein n=1 Tax=Capnocytophaga haemolytica TaxID=45243 RepID=A0AAX2GVX9_9FLAO|nr:hypothetical protein SAMN05444369_101290 [Capnocytophaga haemolytica]SNV04894.1 Uncharacterised protein [Capnocytophaga haemolytica]
MPEPYAVRWTGGKRQVYRTKRDFEYGKLSSFGTTNKRLDRSFGK